MLLSQTTRVFRNGPNYIATQVQGSRFRVRGAGFRIQSHAESCRDMFERTVGCYGGSPQGLEM